MTVEEVAAAMRAVGAGRATIDGITLDLTAAPLPQHTATVTKMAPDETPEEATMRRNRVLFRSTGGVKVKLR